VITPLEILRGMAELKSSDQVMMAELKRLVLVHDASPVHAAQLILQSAWLEMKTTSSKELLQVFRDRCGLWKLVVANKDDDKSLNKLRIFPAQFLDALDKLWLEKPSLLKLAPHLTLLLYEHSDFLENDIINWHDDRARRDKTVPFPAQQLLKPFIDWLKSEE